MEKRKVDPLGNGIITFSKIAEKLRSEVEAIREGKGGKFRPMLIHMWWKTQTWN